MQTRNLERLGYLIGFAIVAAVLYALFGSVGILYALGILGFGVLSNLITALLKPKSDLTNDPMYKQNVQDLVARQRQFESKTE